MFTKKQITLCALLWINTHYGMEENTIIPTTEMTRINKWDDMRPFAGLIIAYQLHNKNSNPDILHYGYTDKIAGYNIPNDTQESKGSAYAIYALKKHTQEHTIFPYNRMLQKNNLEVRNLLPEDKTYIRESLRNKTMKFPKLPSYINHDELAIIVLSLID